MLIGIVVLMNPDMSVVLLLSESVCHCKPPVSTLVWWWFLFSSFPWEVRTHRWLHEKRSYRNMNILYGVFGMNPPFMHGLVPPWVRESPFTVSTSGFLFGVNPLMLGRLVPWVRKVFSSCSQYACNESFHHDWSCDLTDKNLYHNAHWYCFYLVKTWWILACLVLFTKSEKVLSQYAHWYGFSLVWILSWSILWPDLEKVLSQYAHW